MRTLKSVVYPSQWMVVMTVVKGKWTMAASVRKMNVMDILQRR
jgi:hypothetical protein